MLPLQIVLSSLLLQSFKIKDMKQGIHPEYKEVVFWDTSSDFKFLTKSTQFSKETVKWTDGKDYPVIKVEVSSASHPFFTGKKMFLDTAGRVEKFQKEIQKVGLTHLQVAFLTKGLRFRRPFFIDQKLLKATMFRADFTTSTCYRVCRFVERFIPVCMNTIQLILLIF